MSLKIYDAYKFDNEYSVYELNNIVDALRKKVTADTLLRLDENVIKNFMYYYNFRILHGEKRIKELIESNKENSSMRNVWRYLLQENYSMLYYQLYHNELYICGENPHACVWDESRFSFS